MLHSVSMSKKRKDTPFEKERQREDRRIFFILILFQIILWIDQC